MTIDEIRNKIMEEQNNIIAKAFTMQIGALLVNNGIIPIMKQYTKNDIDAITDADRYNLVMEFGVTFDELDTREHDKEVYNKATDDCIDKFADILSNIKEICGRNCPVNCNWGTTTNCKDMCRKWLAEQLKSVDTLNCDNVKKEGFQVE